MDEDPDEVVDGAPPALDETPPPSFSDSEESIIDAES